jgi:hypothetical protein
LSDRYRRTAMIFSPTGGLNLGPIFVYHNRLGVKVFHSLFRRIVGNAPDLFHTMRHRPIDPHRGRSSIRRMVDERVTFAV